MLTLASMNADQLRRRSVMLSVSMALIGASTLPSRPAEPLPMLTP